MKMRHKEDQNFCGLHVETHREVVVPSAAPASLDQAQASVLQQGGSQNVVRRDRETCEAS